jgi:hypothetical protein
LEGGLWLSTSQVQQSITVNQAPSFTGGSSTIFIEDSYGSTTVTAIGTPSPTITEAGNLPNGVNFVSGVLSGTPTQSGSYLITLTASNGFGNPATEGFWLSVVQSPSITSANEATFTTGVKGNFSVLASGYPVPGLTESGTLPSGVTFTGGKLHGTPW